jgi:hypothetical protein
MNAAAPPLVDTTCPPDFLVLLQQDLSPRLEHLLRELVSGGQRLLIEAQNGRGPATFAVGGGIRLYGDAGILNTRTVRAVVGCSIEDASDAFQVDLDGLDYLALMSWAAVLQATQDFRTRGGILRVHARGSTRRLLAMPTAIESDRTNLEITSQESMSGVSPCGGSALRDAEHEQRSDAEGDEADGREGARGSGSAARRGEARSAPILR